MNLELVRQVGGNSVNGKRKGREQKLKKRFSPLLLSWPHYYYSILDAREISF